MDMIYETSSLADSIQCNRMPVHSFMGILYSDQRDTELKTDSVSSFNRFSWVLETAKQSSWAKRCSSYTTNHSQLPQYQTSADFCTFFDCYTIHCLIHAIVETNIQMRVTNLCTLARLAVTASCSVLLEQHSVALERNRLT